jgi:hypothetical protein
VVEQRTKDQTMPDQPTTPQQDKILARREVSAPTSVWTEYLRVRYDDALGAMLEFCRYEALDDVLELVCLSVDDRLLFKGRTYSRAITWCHERGFVFDDALTKVFRNLFRRPPKPPSDPDLEMIEALAKFYDFSKPIFDAEFEAGLKDIIDELGGSMGTGTSESCAYLRTSVASAVARHNRDIKSALKRRRKRRRMHVALVGKARQSG